MPIPRNGPRKKFLPTFDADFDLDIRVEKG